MRIIIGLILLALSTLSHSKEAPITKEQVLELAKILYGEQFDETKYDYRNYISDSVRSLGLIEGKEYWLQRNGTYKINEGFTSFSTIDARLVWNENEIIAINSPYTDLEKLIKHPLYNRITNLTLSNLKLNKSDFYFPKKVHHLAFSSNNIDDFKDIFFYIPKELKYLSIRKLEGDKDINLTFLNNMRLTQLTLKRLYFDIRRYSLKDITLSSLKSFNFDNLDNPVDGLNDFILQNKNLESLDVHFRSQHQKTIDLTPFKQLKHAKFSELEIKSIKELGKNDSLKSLEFDSSTITSLEGIENFPNLEKLIILSKNLTDMTPLSSLKKLKTLKILGKIDKISGLENSKKLECLDLNFNKLESTNGLENNINLKVLSLVNNGIKKIKLSHLKNLQILDVAYNELKELRAKDLPPNVREIGYYHSQYAMPYDVTIDDLSQLLYLVNLDCQDTQFGDKGCYYPDDFTDEQIDAINKELNRRNYEARKAKHFYEKKYDDPGYRSPIINLPTEVLRQKVINGEISEDGKNLCGDFIGMSAFKLYPFATKNPPAKY